MKNDEKKVSFEQACEALLCIKEASKVINDYIETKEGRYTAITAFGIICKDCTAKEGITVMSGNKTIATNIFVESARIVPDVREMLEQAIIEISFDTQKKIINV
jgi:hypothetical protein